LLGGGTIQVGNLDTFEIMTSCVSEYIPMCGCGGGDEGGRSARSGPRPRPRMGRNSFSPDTPVWTAGGQVPIGNLAVGDAVLGYNEATGETAPYTVTAVWAHEDPLVLAVTIDDEVITSTLEHPFYVMLRGWVAAEDLYPGQAVRRVDGELRAGRSRCARRPPPANGQPGGGRGPHLLCG
jgi:hypothetical protein